jgi:hypothetical protein
VDPDPIRQNVKTSVVDPDPQKDPDWIRIQLVFLHADPEPGGQKLSTKIKKTNKFPFLKC